MRNWDIGSSRPAKTRDSPRYVPLVELKSRKRIASRFTSTAQCKRDTSGSSISMSAPPPNRPMVISGRDSSHSIPRDVPVMTQILMVWSCGSVRLCVSGARESSSLEARARSSGAEEIATTVGAPESLREDFRTSTVEAHIQHLMGPRRWLENCASSTKSFELQLGQ